MGRSANEYRALASGLTRRVEEGSDYWPLAGSKFSATPLMQ